MKRRRNEPDQPRQSNIEIRRDLQDSSTGRDLSYLNEMPQMGGYEGVKAGMPPEKKATGKKDTLNNKD